MGMEPRVLWRRKTSLCHLPKLNLKSKVQIKSENA
jgi:hypothetical protein